MTTLDAYLSSDGAKTLTDLSLALKVSKGRLSQLRGSRAWPPELAISVEEVTNGALNASLLSPTVARAREGMAA